MTNQSPSRHDSKQQHESLHNEIADILLGPDSPVRGMESFEQFTNEHDRLVQRQAELKSLDVKLVEVLPGLEQAEAQLAESEKQLNIEKKTLSGFAAELGTAAFAGLRAGELPDSPLFADRKELQSRIDSLQRQKAELVAGENAGMMEKAKIQAQQLKLAGQIKVEELKIGKADRALGVSMLTSKEKLSVRCSHTEEVLTAIANQRKQVTAAKGKVKQAEKVVEDRRASAAETLDRSSLQDAGSLNSELKEVRKEHRQNEKAITSVRSTVVATALETESLREEAILGEKLKQLWSLNFDLEANKTQGRKMVDESVSRFKGLPPKFKYGAYGVAGVVVLLLLMSFFGGDDNHDEVASTDSGNDVLAIAEVDSGVPDAKKNEETLSGQELRKVEKELDSLLAIKALGGKVKRVGNKIWITMDNNTTDDDLKNMRDLTQFEYKLTLRDTQISDQGLKYLKGMKGLEALNLIGTQITDAGLAHLKGLNQLELLGLTNTDVTNKGLVHLKGLTRLTFLGLGGTYITDEGLVHLQGLTMLEQLALDGARVTDNGLVHLSGLAKLRWLKTKGKIWENGDLQAMLASLSDTDGAGAESGIFSYKLGSRNYIGKSTEGSGSQLQKIFPDKSKDRIGVLIDHEEGLIHTTPLGITGGHLHAGTGKENILINLWFFVGDRQGTRAVDGKPNYPVSGFVEAIYLTPGPVKKSHFFGRRASQVPRQQQKMLVRNRSSSVISFGIPDKIEPGSQRDRILYADFSPPNQLAQFRKHLGKSDLSFSIGNRSFQVDESARQQLFLFERAVAVVRYHKGARDFESRKSLGD